MFYRKTFSEVISQSDANALLDQGKAVKENSPEHRKMMFELWKAVATKFVYVATQEGWFYREHGASKGLMNTEAVQELVDTEFIPPKCTVATQGIKNGKARVWRDVPVLAEVSKLSRSVWATDEDMRLVRELIVDYAGTFPGEPKVVAKGQDRVLNFWTAPKVKAIRPEKYEEPWWFIDIIEEFFQGHDGEREYFLDWCAHLVCKPHIKMPVSCLLTSSVHGTGKTTIAEILTHLVGENNATPLTSADLKGNFHSWVPGRTLAIVNELYESGNYGFANRLKTWQSEREQSLNLKYGAYEKQEVAVHFLAFSNESVPLHLEAEDRRWFTFDSPLKIAPSNEWFKKRQDGWRLPPNGKSASRLPNLKALGSLKRWFELRMKAIEKSGRFDPFGRPPMTESKRAIVEFSKSPYFIKVREAMDAGAISLDERRTTTMSGIDSALSVEQSYRPPPPAAKATALRELGWTQEARTGKGRRWVAPEWYREGGPALLAKSI